MTLTDTKISSDDLLDQLSAMIVQGACLDESLDHIFNSFRELIPFDRIGFADIDWDRGVAIARWAKSDDRILLRGGYSAELAHSSLAVVIDKRLPRVLNDLPAYLRNRPSSRSTELIVREGLRSSMTCPLFVDDVPTGMLFFSSRELDAYNDDHVRLMKRIAGHLATLLMISSQESSKVEKPKRRSASPKHERTQGNQAIDFALGQLKPGMVLATPIQLSTGAILLAEGTRLSRTSIDRLIKLSADGVIEVESVLIR